VEAETPRRRTGLRSARAALSTDQRFSSARDRDLHRDGHDRGTGAQVVPFRVRSLTNITISRVSAETVIRSQRSVPAGSTNLSGGREGASRPPLSREPCSPRVEAQATADSGSPAWLMIHAMTAEKSAPSTRIAARSMPSPPDECGRASRITRSFSTPQTALPPRNHARADLCRGSTHTADPLPRPSFSAGRRACFRSRRTTSQRRPPTVALLIIHVARTVANPDVLKTRAAHHTGPGTAVGQPSCSLSASCRALPKRCTAHHGNASPIWLERNGGLGSIPSSSISVRRAAW
jgi:hypothetical protein